MDSVFDEIYWQLVMRLTKALPPDERRIENLLAPSARAQRAEQAEVWISAGLLYFGMLEVVAALGSSIATDDPRISAVMRVLQELPPTPAHPSWRGGLLKGFLERARYSSRRFAEGEPEVSASCEMSEYIGLVREYQNNETARYFMRWVWNQESDKAEFTPAELRSRASQDIRVIEGADLAIRLVSNVHARLVKLENNPSLQSACWCLHGELFEQKAAFGIALTLRLNSLDGADELERLGEFNPEFADRSFVEQVESSERLHIEHWLELSDQARWTHGRTKAIWSEVIGNASPAEGQEMDVLT